MDLSLVIRSGRDEKVLDCIGSVDEDVDIVVSTVPDPDFCDLVESTGARTVTSTPGNLSVVSNIGIDAARYDMVFLTDSDTLLCSGCLEAVRGGLERAPFVNARIEFAHDGTRTSRLVSEARDFVNSKDLAFTPGLGLDRRAGGLVGGYFFDEEVPFAVDANLDYRIRRNGVPVVYDSGARIVHGTETVEHDMVAARRIGAGVRAGAGSLARMYPDTPESRIGHDLKAVHMGDYPRILREKGMGVLLYQMRWDLNFYLGRFRG